MSGDLTGLCLYMHRYSNKINKKMCNRLMVDMQAIEGGQKDFGVPR